MSTTGEINKINLTYTFTKLTEAKHLPVSAYFSFIFDPKAPHVIIQVLLCGKHFHLPCIHLLFIEALQIRILIRLMIEELIILILKGSPSNILIFSF